MFLRVSNEGKGYQKTSEIVDQNLKGLGGA